MRKIIHTNSFVVSAFIISLLYAVIRYNIFKDVPWIDLPLYVFNKALSFTAIILFGVFQYIKSRPGYEKGNHIKEYAVIMAVLHVIISIIIISPVYFEKFYSGQHLNLTGGLTLLFGVLAFGVMLLLSSNYILKENMSNPNYLNSAVYLFFIITAGHIFVMGYEGWLIPGSWPGRLPPISLLSFIVVLSALTFGKILKEKV